MQSSKKALISSGVFVVALFVFFSVLFLSPAQAATYDIESVIYEYSDDDGTLSVTGCHNDAENIHIVSHIRKYPVTTINAYAFCSKSKIKSVQIDGDSLLTIGRGAFSDCENLERINIPASLKSLGAEAFRECQSLQSIDLPQKIGSIPDNCFARCESLTRASCYATGFGNRAFHYCRSLNSFTVLVPPKASDDEDDDYGDEDGDEDEAENADTYDDEDSIDNEDDGLQDYDDVDDEDANDDEDTNAGGDTTAHTVCPYAFARCTALKYVYLPSGFKRIDECAFNAMQEITVYVPDSVTKISSSAFLDTPNVTIRCHEGSPVHLMNKHFNYNMQYVYSLVNAQITGMKDGVYAGSAVKQSLAVMLNGSRLVAGKDYYMTYTNNNTIGLATVTIKTCNELLEGTRSFTYRVNPATPTLKKLKASKKAIKVTWSKSSKVDGYKIRYSTKANMKGAKTLTVGKGSSTSKKISKLKSKKKYYVQVCAYKDVEFDEEDEELLEQYGYEDEERFWSSWGKIKKVKVK